MTIDPDFKARADFEKEEATLHLLRVVASPELVPVLRSLAELQYQFEADNDHPGANAVAAGADALMLFALQNGFSNSALKLSGVLDQCFDPDDDCPVPLVPSCDELDELKRVVPALALYALERGLQAIGVPSLPDVQEIRLAHSSISDAIESHVLGLYADSIVRQVAEHG